MSSLRVQRGQATVELVALLPLVAVVAGLLWQVVLAGQAVWLSGAAAQAAARATAIGADADAAAQRALPRHLARGVTIDRAAEDGVRVRVRIPSIVGGAVLGAVSARARLQPQSP